MEPAPAPAAERPRWGQARRLTFIDVRLQYDGRINRKDLMAFFDISVPQASADLALYQAMAPNNLEYDARLRTYVALPTFAPQFGRSAATRYLDELRRLAREVISEEESFIGFVPATGVVATPARTIESSEVSTIVRAIRDAHGLHVRYQSMDEDQPQHWLLMPHALGFDGLRWHVRAWCHSRKVFRDFAIGRLAILDVLSDAQRVDPATDAGWNTRVDVILKPHPKLTGPRREAVIKDYGMVRGRCVLACRKAMLFYTLRHLNLQGLTTSDNPATQHVVVDNADDVQRWVDEDRCGAVVDQVR
nr:WYL domain-containing protein [uncultured Pseudoxanthomonas sp.]